MLPCPPPHIPNPCQNLTQFVIFNLTSRSLFPVTSGVLTLDAGNKEDAVFIFRTVGALTTTGASEVVLIRGATYKNIYWSAGTIATFAAGTTMQGNVFSDTAITYAAGCTHHGRYDSNKQRPLLAMCLASSTQFHSA